MKSIAGNFIKESYNRIERRYRICFFAGLICGLMAHIYALTNHLYNYDELWHTPTGFGTGVEVGRWALSVTVWLQKIFFADCFTIPFINGFITLLLYALAACFAVAVIDINDEFYAGITGALMTTFPALVSRMFYMFTTHYYAIGIAMTAAGIWILVKYGRSGGAVKKVICIIISAVLVIYGMAIYQANFVTAVCMLAGCLLIDLIRNDPDLKEAVLRCGFYVLYLGTCMAAYLFSSKLALAVTGKKMQTYENLDTMGQLSPGQLVEGILRCYKCFLKLPFRDMYSMNPNMIVRFAFLVSILVLLYTLLKTWASVKALHLKLIITAVMAVLPIAINLIIIMAISSGTMYSIMVYEVVYVLVIPIACLAALSDIPSYRKEDGNYSDRFMKVADVITSIALAATVITYIWFANGNYLSMEYTNMHDNAFFSVLMTQIKSVEGYREDMPVALIGTPSKYETYNKRANINGTFNIGGKAYTNISAYSYWNIMTNVLGFNPIIRNSDEDEEYFCNNPEVTAMPVYPDAGSIKVIDDTIVIKFEE
ncbi:MAG: glucosyltransferase domain-containing protein [Lachnospiraceae bacterium]|nr:glucosyltransferase domain-containing protein [Lachnospiraceae bacterium]